MQEELHRMSKKPKAELLNRLGREMDDIIKADPQSRGTGSLPKAKKYKLLATADKKDLRKRSFLFETKESAQKHWNPRLGTSWAVAVENISDGREFDVCVELPIEPTPPLHTPTLQPQRVPATSGSTL